MLLLVIVKLEVKIFLEQTKFFDLYPVEIFS